MSARQMRNVVPVEDTHTGTQFLVYGAFREDPQDSGFIAVRWLTIDELEHVDDLSEKLDEYVDAIQQMREAVFEHEVS